MPLLLPCSASRGRPHHWPDTGLAFTESPFLSSCFCLSAPSPLPPRPRPPPLPRALPAHLSLLRGLCALTINGRGDALQLPSPAVAKRSTPSASRPCRKKHPWPQRRGRPSTPWCRSPCACARELTWPRCWVERGGVRWWLWRRWCVRQCGRVGVWAGGRGKRASVRTGLERVRLTS